MVEMDQSEPGGQGDEMAVVDVFTQVIFGIEQEFSAEQEAILSALRLEESAAGADLYDLAEHLRSLDVPEMVELVGRVRRRLAEGCATLAAVSGRSPLPGSPPPAG